MSKAAYRGPRGWCPGGSLSRPAGRAGAGNLGQANPDGGVFLGSAEPVAEFPRYGEQTVQDVRCWRPTCTRVRRPDLLEPLPQPGRGDDELDQWLVGYVAMRVARPPGDM